MEFERDFNGSKFVVVYRLNGGDTHCVYIQDYNKVTKNVKAINSHGETNKFPKIHISNILRFYQVECVATLKPQK